jgi:hypothetical protein
MATFPSTHLNKPVIYKDRQRYGRGGILEWFSWQSLSHDPDYVKFNADFLKVGDYSTTDWTLTTTNAGTAAVNTTANSTNGTLDLVTAGTGTDSSEIQLKTSNFVLVAGEPQSSNYNPSTDTLGKRLWFEARLQMTAPTTADLWVGLQAQNTTPKTEANGIGFRIATGSANILLKSALASTVTTKTAAGSPLTAVTMAATTMTRLGMYFDGHAVQYYVNREYVGTINTNLPTVAMAPLLFIGDNAAAAQTLRCDYVSVMAER